MNKVPGKIKISYVLIEIFERPLNIPKRPSIENIGILYNHGHGVRGTNAQRLPGPIREHSHLCQDFYSDTFHPIIYKYLKISNSFSHLDQRAAFRHRIIDTF